MKTPAVHSRPVSARNEKPGRGLLTAAVVSTAVTQPLADLNTSHAFNKDWPPHARLHDLAAIGMLEACCTTSLYLLYTRRGDRDLNTAVAAILPAAFRAPFSPAHFISGSSLDDTTAHHPAPKVPRAGRFHVYPTPTQQPPSSACWPPAGGRPRPAAGAGNKPGGGAQKDGQSANSFGP